MSEMNEIEAAAHAAKRVREAAEKTQRENAEWPMLQIGIGIGVGSAALAAALLYASRSRRDRP